MINKEKIPLIIGLSIPLLMVILLAASIYLPALGAHPKTNFLYCDGDEYSRTKYVLKANKLIEQEVKYPQHYTMQQEAKLNIYDVTTGSSKKISYEQAQEMVLDGNIKSPDGFEVASDDSGGYGMFPFYYSHSNYGQKYLKKGNYSKKLEINLKSSSRSYYYDYGFNFIGWVLQGE
ncbi:MAG: hypothetical protein WCH62_02590 [Candidatus Omnitrophota bacterium]